MLVPVVVPSCRPLTEKELKAVITDLNENDVLCDRRQSRFAGTTKWKDLVEANQELYHELKNNAQKDLLAKSIVNAIRRQEPPGRFLRKHKAADTWYEIGNERAFSKTQQALRRGFSGAKANASSLGQH